jgi:hypothetical protein
MTVVEKLKALPRYGTEKTCIGSSLLGARKMEDASFAPVRWLFNFDAWKLDDGDWGDALELIPEEERARIGRLVLS